MPASLQMSLRAIPDWLLPGDTKSAEQRKLVSAPRLCDGRADTTVHETAKFWAVESMGSSRKHIHLKIHKELTLMEVEV